MGTAANLQDVLVTTVSEPRINQLSLQEERHHLEGTELAGLMDKIVGKDEIGSHGLDQDVHESLIVPLDCCLVGAPVLRDKEGVAIKVKLLVGFAAEQQMKPPETEGLSDFDGVAIFQETGGLERIKVLLQGQEGEFVAPVDRQGPVLDQCPVDLMIVDRGHNPSQAP